MQSLVSVCCAHRRELAPACSCGMHGEGKCFLVKGHLWNPRSGGRQEREGLRARGQDQTQDLSHAWFQSEGQLLFLIPSLISVGKGRTALQLEHRH